MKIKIAIGLLIAILINTLAIPVSANAENYTHTLINIVVSKDGNGYVETVDALIEENDIYVKAEQLASMTKYTYKKAEDNRGIFRLGLKTVVVDYKKQTLRVNGTIQSFSGAILSNGEYFLPFSEITPWLNVSVDIDKGYIRLESDVLSYWEVLEGFKPSDYYFFYAAEMGDELTSVVGLSAMHVFDSLLNLEDVWKKVVTVTGEKGDISLYDYEVYVDTFREFAIPEDSTAEVYGIISKIGKTFSNYSKLKIDLIKGVESEDCYKEIAYAVGKLASDDLIKDRETLIEKGSKVIGEYDSWVIKDQTWPQNYKYINNAFKVINSGYSCMRIMEADTESYSKALKYIYLRENAQTTGGEKRAAKKIVGMMESNAVSVLESAKPLAGKFVYEYCQELVKNTIEEAKEIKISKSSIGTYLTIVDTALSAFWPVNNAFGEVTKLPVYTAIQQNAYDTFSDLRITNAEVNEESLETSRMTAIIYLRATRKCFEVKDGVMSVFGASGLLDYYYHNVNEMIGNFELCLLAQEHDAIEDKQDFTRAIRNYLIELGLLLQNGDSETETTTSDKDIPDVSPNEVAGQWFFYYTTFVGGETTWVQELRLYENGEAIAANGIVYGEYHYRYTGTWSMAEGLDENILTFNLHGGPISQSQEKKCNYPEGCTDQDHQDYVMTCEATVDGDAIKLELISISSGTLENTIWGHYLPIDFGNWYGRDWDFFG